MNQPKRIKQALTDFLDRIVVAMSLDVTANLKQAPSEGGTPVDTGWARANWVPHIGQPFRGTAGSPDSVNTARSEEGVAEVAAGYSVAKGQVHITNNVPYITRLNDGHSQQAPAGFVQRAIDKAVRVDLPAKLVRRS